MKLGILTEEVEMPSRELRKSLGDAGFEPRPRPCDARLGPVFVVHATKKLLDRCGGPAPAETPTTTALGDWYATALFWSPQVALFVNDSTRLPVFVRLAPAATLLARFVTDLTIVLGAHGLDPRFIDAELAEMTEHRLEQTASRSVVGTMNDYTYLAAAHRDHHGVDDLVDLSLTLARTPCGPLRDRTGFPDLELKALVERALDAS